MPSEKAVIAACRAMEKAGWLLPNWKSKGTRAINPYDDPGGIQTMKIVSEFLEAAEEAEKRG